MSNSKRHTKKLLYIATVLSLSSLALPNYAATYTYEGTDTNYIENNPHVLTDVWRAASTGLYTVDGGTGLIFNFHFDLKGPYNDNHLTVTNLQGIGDVIYTTLSHDYNAQDGVDSGANNSSLTINLGNKDGTVQQVTGGIDKNSGSSYGFANVAVAAVQVGQATSNTLTITDSNIEHTAQSKQLIIHTASVDSAYSDDGTPNISNNQLIIENSTLKSKNNYGFKNIQLGAAYFYTQGSGEQRPQLENNEIKITNSEIDVHSIETVSTSGAYNYTPTSSSNTLAIVNSTINTGALYSDVDGYLNISGARIVTSTGIEDSSSNSLTISEGTKITHDLGYGVASTEGKHRELTIATVLGGEHIFENTLFIDGLTLEVINNSSADTPSTYVSGEIGGVINGVDTEVVIAVAAANTVNGWTPDPDIHSNRLTITNSTINEASSTAVYGGMISRASEVGDEETSAKIYKNTVDISDTTFGDVNVFGAALGNLYSVADSPDIVAEQNTVTLTNVTAKNLKVFGAQIDDQHASQAKSNIVTVSGGQFESMTLVGGLVMLGDQAESKVSGNTIEVTGAVKADTGSIYGGYLDDGVSADQGLAQDNIVKLSHEGTLNLVDLYGGFSNNSSASYEKIWKGNELNLNSGRVVTENMNGFQTYNFYIQQSDVNSDGLIKVTGDKSVLIAKGQDGSNNTGTVIGIGIKGNLTLANNDKVTLIDSASGFVDETGANWAAGSDLSGMLKELTVSSNVSLSRVRTYQFSSEDYELKIDEADDNLLVLDKVGSSVDPLPPTDTTNPETDILMQSSISSLATLFAADDLLIDTALKSRNNFRQDGAFAAMRAGTFNYDTGNNFETNVYSGLLGWAMHSADVEFGPFVEMGHSDYEMNQGASGKHNYAGVGMYINWQTPYRFRVTGYVKGGAMQNDFQTHLVGETFEFDHTSAYWGLHVGANIDFNITERFRARPFVSYFYDGRDSETYTQHGGEVDGSTFNYDTINAHRVQIGSMFEYAYLDTGRPYFGLTYEQVIKAEAEGSALDKEGQVHLTSSDIEGGTCIVSAGWTYVSELKDFEFNLGANGYLGNRSGASAQMSANWKF